MIHLPHDMESKYRFITMAAQRCNQLIRGAKPRVETRSEKYTTIAQEEVLAGAVDLKSEEELLEILAGPEPATEAPAEQPGRAAPEEPVALEAGSMAAGNLPAAE